MILEKKKRNELKIQRRLTFFFFFELKFETYRCKKI